MGSVSYGGYVMKYGGVAIISFIIGLLISFTPISMWAQIIISIVLSLPWALLWVSHYNHTKGE